MIGPKVFTWSLHGSYLYYLSQAHLELYVPKGEGPGYGGLPDGFPWGNNVHEVPVADVKNQQFDLILFQAPENYLEGQHTILSAKQRALPKMYLEHDPPFASPTNAKHPVDDPDILLVHVTNFNNLMWDNNRTPTQVIENGVSIPDGVEYTGEEAKGIVVAHSLAHDRRRLGGDIVAQLKSCTPLDIAGAGTQALGGLGEVPHQELIARMAQYRFLFHPARYSSLSLAVCEAMMAGIPVVGLATTAMPATIQNGITGFISNDIGELADHMRRLLNEPDLAASLGASARSYAQQRFSIHRFAQEWEAAVAHMLH